VAHCHQLVQFSGRLKSLQRLNSVDNRSSLRIRSKIGRCRQKFLSSKRNFFGGSLVYLTVLRVSRQTTVLRTAPGSTEKRRAEVSETRRLIEATVATKAGASNQRFLGSHLRQSGSSSAPGSASSYSSRLADGASTFGTTFPLQSDLTLLTNLGRLAGARYRTASRKSADALSYTVFRTAPESTEKCLGAVFETRRMDS
jgi:hypothetical protein